MLTLTKGEILFWLGSECCEATEPNFFFEIGSALEQDRNHSGKPAWGFYLNKSDFSISIEAFRNSNSGRPDVADFLRKAGRGGSGSG